MVIVVAIRLAIRAKVRDVIWIFRIIVSDAVVDLQLKMYSQLKSVDEKWSDIKNS